MIPYILDFCDSYYPILSRKRSFIGKQFLCHILLSIRYHINNILCTYYHTVKKSICPRPEDCDYIVTLTSYPARMEQLWKVLEMIFNQRSCKTKYAVVLNLITSEFENHDIPYRIKDLQKRGLVIKFHSENLKCHNKYIYTLLDYPEKTIITVDDDLQYNHHTITLLIKYSNRYPNCVIFNRGYLLLKNRPYNEWPIIDNKTEPRLDAFPTGVGGVLYPPNCFHAKVTDIATIKQTCLRADDLWLNFMTRLNNTKTVCTGMKSTFIQLPESNQELGLFHTNTCFEQNGNDTQIKNISNWARNIFNCDYFVNL